MPVWNDSIYSGERMAGTRAAAPHASTMPRGIASWTGSLVVATLLAVAEPAAADCTGDCDGNGQVTIEELITMVRAALGENDPAACPAGDADGDGRIDIAELVGAVRYALDGCPPAEPDRTLDDALGDVARLVPEFGGMFFADDEQVLEVYLSNPSAERLAAVEQAIVGVFGPIIPDGGLRARHGQYGFAELRGWYAAMVGPVLAMSGVVATDIDEAANRVAVHVDEDAAENAIAATVADLGIPADAVAIRVTGPMEPLSHILQDVQSPRRGGFQITRLINNIAGFGIVAGTLGFNATRNGVPGFVTNSHNTQVFWRIDTAAGFGAADFYQAPGYFPAEWVGTETVDTPAFACPPPYPAGFWCRYSDSAFAPYHTGVAIDPGIIGRTTSQTVLTSTSAALSLAVDHGAAFTITAAPTKPYLVGLTLHKVGRTTGWTSGAIVGTCLDYSQTNPLIHPGTTIRRCQYLFGDPTLGLASFGDSGSPVFRIADAGCGYVQLYGILWGGGSFIVPPPPWGGSSVGRTAAFSPIGGVPTQWTGVQSPEDLGKLTYANKKVGPCTPIPASATATASRTPTAPRPLATPTVTPTPRPTSTVMPLPSPTATGTAAPTATATGCVSGAGANLVPNPSFESSSAIPTSYDQVPLAVPWNNPTLATPDYYHALAPAASGVGVPNNDLGSEPAHTGVAYVGIHARPVNVWREYVEIPLLAPLIAGTTYQVSFYVSLSDRSRWAVDRLGAHLSVGPVGPLGIIAEIPVTPQVNASGYITTKNGWVQIQGAYTAGGGEDHLVIGNFFDNAATIPLTGQGGLFDFAYYYIDDVEVVAPGQVCTPTPTAAVTATATRELPPTAMQSPTPTASRPPIPTATATPTPSPTCPPGVLCGTPTATRPPSATATATGTRTASPTCPPGAVCGTPTATRTANIVPATIAFTPPATVTATSTRTPQFPVE